MKPTDDHAAPNAGTAVCCDVPAYGTVSAKADEIAVLRRRPGPGIGESLPNNFLKHSDEQTVVGLAAVLQAMQAAALPQASCRDWGIVAAPFFLGRAVLAQALHRFAHEGAWGFSPHIIPHRSQHAISGTISQVLKIHGPNFGAGGGPGGVVEALIAGAVLVEADRLPGAWVVLTGWDTELIPDREGQPTGATTCRAVALALVAPEAHHEGLRMRVAPAMAGGPKHLPAGLGAPVEPGLETLLTMVAGSGTPATTIQWELKGGGWLEIGGGGIAATLAGPKALRRPSSRQRIEVPQAPAGTEK